MRQAERKLGQHAHRVIREAPEGRPQPQEDRHAG